MPRDKNIFTLNPTSLDMRRSVFNRNSQHKTSFNLGQIVPIYLDEILPGDTVSLDLAQVIRIPSPLSAPIMDNLYGDVYFFFVPNRIVWPHWVNFNGQNDTGAWTQTGNYSVPMTDVGETSGHNLAIGSLGDYFGLPLRNAATRSGSGSIPNTLMVSELPLRAYYKIYNDWFADENSIGPVVYTVGDTYNTAIRYSDSPKKASRFHDLFSSALPAPQKGASVILPLGEKAYLGFEQTGTGTLTPSVNGLLASYATDASSKIKIGDNIMTDGNNAVQGKLFADLSTATAATINQLRTAFQVQKLLEKDARGGSRYVEILKCHFGVTSPDSRLQRAEYLAGHRFRINVDQVVATADSGSSGSSVVGETGALSKTVQAGSMFTKSFTEHGMLIGLVVIRQDHTYSQGLDRYWLKKDRFDFYWPVLANIGEVPVFKSEIDCRGGSSVAPGEPSGVFGYQEAWYDYRYKCSRCSSYMNPIAAGSLNYWTLGDAYSSVPGLNSTFLEEAPDFLDRALHVPSTTMHQFIADFYFKAKFGRVMPLYSIPGLIDHH